MGVEGLRRESKELSGRDVDKSQRIMVIRGVKSIISLTLFLAIVEFMEITENTALEQ